MQSKSMTPRERIIAAFRREEVDRPPVTACFIRWMRGRYHCASELQQLVALEEFGLDPLIYHGSYLHNMTINDYIYKPDGNDAYRDLPGVNVDVHTENHENCTIHKRRFETPAGVLTDRIRWSRPDMGYGDGPNPVREEPLVKTMADAEALPFILPLPRQSMIRDLQLFSEIVGERGVVEFPETAGAGSFGLEALGYENMLMCAAEQPELLKKVIATCHQQHLRNLKAVLESGHKHIVVSWFQCSASTGWSPDHVRDFFLPLMRESVELVHSYGALYRHQDDGRMRELIPLLVDIGTDMVGGLQPPPVGDCDFGEIKNKYGDKIALMGGLDPVYTFERGSPEAVRKAVYELLDAAGDGRGVFVNQAEAFGPETTEETVRALPEAVKKYWKNRA